MNLFQMQNPQAKLWADAARAGRPIDPATGLPRVSSSELQAGHLTGVDWPASTYSGRGYLPGERSVYNGAPFYGFGVGARGISYGYNPAGVAESNLSAVVDQADKQPGWGTFAAYAGVNAALFAAVAYFLRRRLRRALRSPGTEANLVNRVTGSDFGMTATGATAGVAFAGLSYMLVRMFYMNEGARRAAAAQMFLNSEAGQQLVATQSGAQQASQAVSRGSQ